MIILNFAKQVHAWQYKKTWMTFFCLKSSFLSSNSLIPSGSFTTNCHLVILNGHGTHVTLESIKYTQDLGLDIITLPYALQSLDVT
jgi:hypothetical protein